jgi:hypothetical protein
MRPPGDPAAFLLSGSVNFLFILRCKPTNAAMQTNALLVASGIHNVFPDHEANLSPHFRKGNTMSKTASIALDSSGSLFGRVLASIDRLLTMSAAIAVRNGDQPHFGL